jgi:glycosyltransferase involved in cell wall biosynthesis
MKVTIITVVRNAVTLIESTINSVLNQSYNDIEYIVVDGDSNDGTTEVIAKYRDKISTIITEKDDGLYDALNKGVKIASGEWIGILNAGDIFTSNDVIANTFQEAEKYSDVGVIYGDAIAVDGDLEIYAKSDDTVSRLTKEPCYRHGASFVRRDVHKEYLFDLSKKPLVDFALDFDQMFRMHKGGVKFRRINLPIIKYALRGVSTVSPFKPAYYNYLITHDMKCHFIMRRLIEFKSLWNGLFAIMQRLCAKIKK